jgi:hypothetical protein
LPISVYLLLSFVVIGSDCRMIGGVPIALWGFLKRHITIV